MIDDVSAVDAVVALPSDGADITLFDLLLPLVMHFRALSLISLAVGLAALGTTYWIAPTFTSKTLFLPPQQQSTAASTLASLGSLASLASPAGLRTPADQYVALMQSEKVSDKLIDKFALMQVFDTRLRVESREKLAKNARFGVGKKDGLISVEIDAGSPQLAADIANAYVSELRALTAELAVTEAQQRRRFFEEMLGHTRDALSRAQLSLQASGFSLGSLRAEPRAAAEGYARMKGEVTAAEVRLQTLRNSLADEAPEVGQQLATLAALRQQLARLEQISTSVSGSDSDYVGKYREFKYQETLFELYARQYELARVDESREGALIQVVDVAVPPERRSRPLRALTAVASCLATGVLLALILALRKVWHHAMSDPRNSRAAGELRAMLRRRG